jgi:LacI family transcriptional regulator
MPTTHQEIADRAGVSRALVTRALHRTHRARVSPRTRHEILKVARELGYQPRNFTTYNIGYVGRTDALRLAGESRFLLLIDQALRRAGFRLVLTSLSGDDKDPHIDEILNPKTVDGVIFSRWFGGQVCNVLSPEVPRIVVSDEDAIPLTVDKVVMDTVGIAEKVVEHFLELGHRHIGIVASPGKGGVTGHLHQGVEKALVEAGLPGTHDSIEVHTDADIANGLEALMNRPDAPTAFLVFGAEKSVTVLNVLNFLGYRVPEDVSLISLIDSHLLEPILPAITATTAMDDVVATRTVARLLERIENPTLAPRHILVPGELIHRQSVGPVRRRRKKRSLGGS